MICSVCVCLLTGVDIKLEARGNNQSLGISYHIRSGVCMNPAV